MLQMYGQRYRVIRMQLRRPESTAERFPEHTILGQFSTVEKWTGPDSTF
jgi:hypothetical protein